MHPLRQGRFQFQLLHETVQGLYIVPGRLPGLQARRQTLQRFPHPAAQFVHSCQNGLPPLVPRRTVAVRVFRPVLVPEPRLAVDVPFQNIVFQQVTFFCRQARQTGFQPAEHILVLIAVGDGGQHAGQQAQHRLFQNVAAAAEIHRDPVPLKHRFDGPGVLRHIPGRHGDVPAAALPRRQQSADVGGGLLHLGIDGGGLPEPDGGAVALVGQILPEEMALQMPKGR